MGTHEPGCRGKNHGLLFQRDDGTAAQPPFSQPRITFALQSIFVAMVSNPFSAHSRIVAGVAKRQSGPSAAIRYPDSFPRFGAALVAGSHVRDGATSLRFARFRFHWSDRHARIVEAGHDWNCVSHPRDDLGGSTHSVAWHGVFFCPSTGSSREERNSLG